METPKPTSVVAKGDDFFLKTSLMGAAVHSHINITSLPQQRTAEALDLVVSEYVTREPLLRVLQRVLGKSEPVSREALLAYLKDLWSNQWAYSSMAVASPPSPRDDVFCETAFKCGETGATDSSLQSERRDELHPIVGACFCRIVEENGVTASQDTIPNKHGKTISDSAFSFSSISTAVKPAEVDYYSRVFPTPVNVWALLPPKVSDQESKMETSCGASNDTTTGTSDSTCGLSTRSPRKRYMLELGLIAVNVQYSNRGVGQYLVSRSIAIAKKHHCSLVKVDCTNHFLHKALSHFQFRLVKEIVCLPPYVHAREPMISEPNSKEDISEILPASAVDIDSQNGLVSAPSSTVKSTTVLSPLTFELDYPHTSLHVLACVLSTI